MRKSFALAVAIVLLHVPEGSAIAACQPVSLEGAEGREVPLTFENIGQAVRTWTDYQCSGQAAGTSHPQEGEVAARSYTRYLKSFEHPIPDFFVRPDKFIQK